MFDAYNNNDYSNAYTKALVNDSLIHLLRQQGIKFLESLQFFKHVSVFDFLFRTVWAPQSADADPKHSFGVIPLLSGTLLIAFIAVVVATMIGVLAAIYMAEYMPAKLRKLVKPALEILAGIPSIVYGFFAAITFAPFVVRLLTSWGFIAIFCQ